MAVRSKRLAAGVTGAAGGFVNVYTCPVGMTCILKRIRVHSKAGTATTFLIWVSSGSTSVDLEGGSLGAGVRVSYEFWLVLAPGDSIGVHNSAAGGMSYWMSGAELLGVAP